MVVHLDQQRIEWAGAGYLPGPGLLARCMVHYTVAYAWSVRWTVSGVSESCGACGLAALQRNFKNVGVYVVIIIRVDVRGNAMPVWHVQVVQSVSVTTGI